MFQGISPQRFSSIKDRLSICSAYVYRLLRVGILLIKGRPYFFLCPYRSFYPSGPSFNPLRAESPQCLTPTFTYQNFYLCTICFCARWSSKPHPSTPVYMPIRQLIPPIPQVACRLNGEGFRRWASAHCCGSKQALELATAWGGALEFEIDQIMEVFQIASSLHCFGPPAKINHFFKPLKRNLDYNALHTSF